MDINTVTVLGANGTMGRNVAGIFASFGNAKVYMICRTKQKAEKAKIQAYQSIRAESIKDNLIPKSYDDLEACISESDLVFESISEDIDLKKDMYERIYPYLKDGAVVATGTSGLSIKELAASFKDKESNFFGIHMFNPPYNLTLCELVLHNDMQRELSIELKNYLENKLNRTVVEVKDSPSFLGNRIGFFFINEILILADKYKDQGGIDYIDSVIGCFTGRNMAPLVTADFVGLDVTKSIVDYIYSNTDDIFKDSFKSNDTLNSLVKDNKLGRKVNYGFYHKDRDRNLLYVYDIKQNNYRVKNDYQFYFSNEMIKLINTGDYENAVKMLLNDESLEAQICKEMLLKYIVYSLKITHEVAYDISYCDDAMATGFSWLPPIALIDLFGGKEEVRKLVNRYLDSRYQNIVNDLEIFDSIPDNSKYDYRPFLKARY